MLKLILLLSVVALAVYAIPGGWVNASVDDGDVVAAANHAAKNLSAQFSDKYHHKLIKIVKAKKQVVAGMNYKLDVIVGRTKCKKNEFQYENVAKCDIQEGISTYKKCQVSVHVNLKGEHQLKATGCILASKKDLLKHHL